MQGKLNFASFHELATWWFKHVSSTATKHKPQNYQTRQEAKQAMSANRCCGYKYKGGI